MTDACTTALQILGDGLIENGYLPAPVFWEGPFCTGRQSPTLDSWPDPESYSKAEPTTHNNPFAPRTVYVPSHMSVTFKHSDDRVITDRLSISGNDLSETLILDIDVQFPYLDSLRRCTYQPTFGTPGTSDSPNAIMELCRGQDVYFGSKLFELYRPQSETCDSMFEEWCNSTELRMQNVDCNCYRDRRDLRAKYPGVNLPVRCMGPNCAISGYRTADMDAQKCNQLICKSSLELIGDDLTNDTDTRVFCGQSFYQKKDGTIVESSDHFVENPAQPGHFVYVGEKDAVQRSSERYVLEEFMPVYVLAIVLFVLFALAIGVGIWIRSSK